MDELQSLFRRYDRLVLFDTETTGLDFQRDEIIEFAAVAVEQSPEGPRVAREYDELVTLSPGMFVPPQIVSLTGITDQDIRERGLPKTRVCRDIAELITGNTLLLAYNAHFDLSFLYYLLVRHGDPAILKGKDKLDLLTVYRDRHSYPHRLKDAIEGYGLSGRVVPVRSDALEKPAGLGEFTCIVCNPPYIPTADIDTLDGSVRDFEPHLALDGGADGYRFYRSISEKWRDALAPGGRLYFEVGIGQADEVLRIMRGQGFGDIQIVRDLHDIPRVVYGTLCTEL